ncbi:MAG: PAS domain S-box protein [Prolixibacteraceae bacterium]
MMKKPARNQSKASLRQKAKELLKERTSGTSAILSEAETIKLIHELEVHQIELELQHKELLVVSEAEKESREKYADLYDFAPNGYFSLTKEGKITELNLTGAKILGLERSKIINRWFGTFVSKDTLPVFIDCLHRIFHNSVKGTCQITLLTINQQEVFVQLTGIKQEKDRHCLINLTDITEYKRVSTELDKSNSLLQSILEKTTDAVFVKDLDGKYLMFNHAAELLTGKMAEDVIGKDDTSVFQFGDATVVMENDRKVMADGRPTTFEEVVTNQEGLLSTFLSTKGRISSKDGSLDGLYGIARDITLRKQMEVELRKSEEKWHSLFEILPVGVSIVDSMHQLTEFNNSLGQILDITNEGLLNGKYDRRIYLRADQTLMDPNEFPSYRALKENIVIRDIEIGVKKEDGSLIWTNVSAIPLPQQNATVTVTTDITRRKLADANIIASEARYRRLFESAKDGILIIDATTGRIIDINPFLVGILGNSPDEFINKEIWEIGFFSDIFAGEANFLELQKAEHIRYDDMPLSTFDGRVLNVEVVINVYTANNKRKVLCNLRDVTERKRMEDELRKSEEKWRSLVSNSPDFIALTDIKGRFLFLNRYEEGFSEKEIYGTSSFNLISVESRAIYRATFEKCVRTMTKQEIEFSGMGSRGEKRLYESALVPLPGENHEISGVLVVARDITHRKQAEEEVFNSKQQLDLLYKHLNQVREEERTSIAREIHDDLGQSLAGLKIDLVEMRKDMGENSGSIQKINKAISLVEGTMKTVQKISSELRPQMLDELGLASAIEWQIREFRKRTGMKCVHQLEDIEDMDEEISISLYRIFQASLTNIMLHSKANSLSVILSMIQGVITLKMKDDGVGIRKEQINSLKSFGIIGMKERTNQIKGTFTIHTGINKGTEIIVSVPFRKKRRDIEKNEQLMEEDDSAFRVEN